MPIQGALEPIEEQPVATSEFDAWMLQHGGMVAGGCLGAIAIGIVWGNIYSIIEGKRGLRIARDGAGWPTHPAEVLTSVVDTTYNSRTRTTRYGPMITYQYTINGKAYKSLRILATTFDFLHDKSWAQGWVDAYPVGRQLAVHVNPKNPHECIVESWNAAGSEKVSSGKIIRGWWGLAFGIGMLAFILCLVWPGWFAKD